MASVVEGSNPFTHPRHLTSDKFVEKLDGPLAQLVEQLTLNQRVSGSSPERPTKKIKDLDAFQAKPAGAR